MPWVRSRFRSALFEQHRIARSGLLELGFDDALGLEIRGGDEFTGPLDRNLQLLDLAEVTQQRACRLKRGVSHDIQGRRPGGHGKIAARQPAVPVSPWLARRSF